MAAQTVTINRAPVRTLWAAVVAEHQGYDEAAALTLGKAVAGLNAQSKGRSLGIYGPPKATERDGKPKKKELGEDSWVEVCGRPVPVKETEGGLRAVARADPIDPESVRRYLAGKFGDSLDSVRKAMSELAGRMSREELTERSYDLYERFRPAIPAGKKGWGAKGELDLGLIRELAREGQ